MQSQSRIAFVIAFLTSNICLAAPGDVDTSFGIDGRVYTDFFGQTDVLNTMALDKQGRILASGSASERYLEDNFALARYTSDGKLDASFANFGRLTTSKVGNNKYLQDGVNGLGIQSDGGIIVCGRGIFEGISGLVVLRYNDDGSLDQTFAQDGSAFIDDDIWQYHPLSLTLDDSDRIIVVAAGVNDGWTKSSFAVFRFSKDGALDNDFGLDGKVLTKITKGLDVPRAVKIDHQGNIVVGGFTGLNKFVVVRYLTQGVLDDSFGEHGKSIIYFNDGGIDTLNALVIDDSGNIVVGGDVQVDSFAGLRMVDFGLARLLSNGQLDRSFNGSGTIITQFIQRAASSLWALALDSDNKIIAVGDASVAKGLAMTRINPDGSFDESFGNMGKQVTVFGKTCHFESVLIQQDGKIVAGGYIFNSKQYDMALIRYSH